ncbi:hypothetical protein [Pyxidicoccus sp. MSG2]|uniref:hypothetical protein n=1 Tax=Pyxidicoccus sp. MSG2 TaxID=2996790 RepID=UPI00226DBB3E|nr:hypothetical protein [Pyxidicoccus sp. MSG2]MCY1023214.1 hypothetical protein [Pyxidicoccus sp. MSG2]
MRRGMWSQTCVLALVAGLLAACGPEVEPEIPAAAPAGQQRQAVSAALQSNLSRLSGQYGNSGVGLQRKVMERASGIMAQNRPYIFDGVQDCYGFVRQVWNALLADGGTHPEDYSPNAYNRARWLGVSGGLPVADYPSADWEAITDWNELVPGDVLSTHQGHAWGDQWHGAIFGGRGADGAFYVYDNSSSMNGAYFRVYTGFAFFHRPIHNLLIQAAPTPGVGTNSDGRLEVFMKGRDGAIYRSAQGVPNGGFSGWSSLGGQLAGNPVVGRNQDGRLSLFVRGPSKDLWVINQASGGWSGWSGLGGRTNLDPAVASNLDGRLTFATRGNSGEVYVRSQTAANSGFGNWTLLGGGAISNRPTLAAWQDGRLEMYGRGLGRNVLRRTQGAPNGSWGGWSSLAGELHAETVARRHADGRVFLFVRGLNNDELFYGAQTAANGSWGSWLSLGGPITSDAAVGVNTDGSLDVFVRGTAGALYTRRLYTSGAWSNWVDLGGVTASNPAAGRYADGRGVVFILGNNGVLHMRRQVSASSEAWTDWEVVGDSVSRF